MRAGLVFGVDAVGWLGLVADELRGCRAEAAGESALAGEFLFAWARLWFLDFGEPEESEPSLDLAGVPAEPDA